MVGHVISRGTKKTPDYSPTPAAVELLRALARFHYLTVEQGVRLFYSKASVTRVRALLAMLYEHNYCERRALPLPPLTRGGSAPFLYTLGQKGRTFVDTVLDMDVPARFRPSEIPKRNQLPHIVACVDVYISAYLLCQRHEDLTLERLIVERALRGLGKPVDVDGRQQRVTPDGFLSVVAHVGVKRYRYPLIPEVDKDSERQAKWRAKVRALLAWFDSPQYGELFGTRNGTVAVISPGKPKHAEVLRAWTEAELTELGRQGAGEHFLFTGTDPAMVPIEAFFPGCVWRQAFGEELIAALDVEVSAP